MKWYWLLVIVLVSATALAILSTVFYKSFFKRFYDIVFSILAIIVLSPVLLLMTVVGAIAMRGNPFFVQFRPGKNGRVFKLIKFRSMDNRKDENGVLLPDEIRLNKYGKFIRKASLDELPELFNIFAGQMSIVGPRPLLVEYLPRYNERQRHRHDVLPGLTGYAQCHGRNAVTWKERLELDVWYVEHFSLRLDIGILFQTVWVVIKREGITSSTSETMEDFLGND